MAILFKRLPNITDQHLPATTMTKQVKAIALESRSWIGLPNSMLDSCLPLVPRLPSRVARSAPHPYSPIPAILPVAIVIPIPVPPVVVLLLVPRPRPLVPPPVTRIGRIAPAAPLLHRRRRLRVVQGVLGSQPPPTGRGFFPADGVPRRGPVVPRGARGAVDAEGVSDVGAAGADGEEEEEAGGEAPVRGGGYLEG